MEPISNSQYEAATLGGLPNPELIAGGLWSVPIPMPGKFLAYTLAVVSAPEGAAVSVIDPGWRSAPGLDLFSSFLASVGRKIAEVETIVITHIHPDHFGLVEDIREKSGAQVMMHHREQEAQGRGREDGSKALRDRFESWGLPQARAGKLLREIEAGNEESPWVQPDRVLHDEETIQIPDSSWLVVPTPGHTTGHICIADEDRQILFSRDHILPAGFPGLGLGGPSDSNPVSDYLDSLERISVYDHFDLVPGHGYHFRGLAGRRQNGRDHTLARAREVAMVTAAHPNLSTYELAAKLTWSGGWKQLEESFMVFSALTQTEIYTQFIAEGGLHRPEARARIEGD